jgi:hypothetical protein
MSKGGSDWHIPADWQFHLGMLVMIPLIALLAGILCSGVELLLTAGGSVPHVLGISVGIFGVVLLFISRLPLYRTRRFWTLGPGQLGRKHRQVYWLAYAAVTASVLLLGIGWLRAS